MSLVTWFFCLAVCAVFGSKAIAALRHYCIQDKSNKSSVKVIDLCMASVLGLIPIINFICGVLAIVISLVVIFLECIEFKKGYLHKNLFGGDDD
jgi:hypothetical protein